MNRFLALLTLNFFSLIALNAISFPNPIEGSPNIFSRKHTVHTGSFVFEIDIPHEWGVGNYSASPDGSALFELYPRKGGNGCMIQIQSFHSNDQAMGALNNIRNEFKSTINLDDGFEVELANTWFSCRVNGDLLIQTWYCLPQPKKKKKKQQMTEWHKAQWQSLKGCIHCSIASDFKGGAQSVPGEENHPKGRDPAKKTVDGWMFNHPTKDQVVFFKTFFRNRICSDKNFSYSLSFEDIGVNADGYFYIDWDQMDLDSAKPYQNLAVKMSEEIKAIDSKQSFDSIDIVLEEGYAILSGRPYGIVIVAGDGFLFGFAVKPIVEFRDVDLNDLINKVKWSALK